MIELILGIVAIIVTIVLFIIGFIYQYKRNQKQDSEVPKSKEPELSVYFDKINPAPIYETSIISEINLGQLRLLSANDSGTVQIKSNDPDLIVTAKRSKYSLPNHKGMNRESVHAVFENQPLSLYNLITSNSEIEVVIISFSGQVINQKIKFVKIPK